MGNVQQIIPKAHRNIYLSKKIDEIYLCIPSSCNTHIHFSSRKLYRYTTVFEIHNHSICSKAPFHSTQCSLMMMPFVHRADTSSSDGGGQKTSRLNGFLNLKTPLISTKTLG